jgi:signal transduction histidine kinase
LAIANAIVKAHDGRVWVEDTPGGGATFAFEIPVRDRDAGDLPREPVVEGDRA